MNGNDFITSLRTKLGNRSAADLPSASILIDLEDIRKTILERAAFKPWFLQNEDTSISTVALQEYVNLPVGFLAFDEEDEWSGVAYSNPADVTIDPWTPLTVDDFNTIKAYYKAGTTSTDTTSSGIKGKPVRAAIVGTKLYMRPIPDAVYALRFRFYKTDTAIADVGVETLWLQYASDWLMGEIGVQYAGLVIQNSDLIPFFDDLRTKGRNRIYRDTIARQEANKHRQQGDE
jgi:hypothetical protein